MKINYKAILTGFFCILLSHTVLATTLKVNSSTKDGYVIYDAGLGNCDQTRWNTVHNADVGTGVDNSSANTFMTKSYCTGGAAGESIIIRSFFYFNTSSIPDTATIDSVAFNFSIEYNVGGSVVCLNGTQEDSLTTADYNSYTGSPYGFINTSKLGDGWNNITFNSLGRDNIDKTGLTKLACLDFNFDYPDNLPTTLARCGMYYSEEYSKEPHLIIEYTEAPTDTCTAPEDGDWNVDCADECDWTTAQNVPDDLYLTGAGTVHLSAPFTFTGANQRIIINSGCTLDITSGGQIG